MAKKRSKKEKKNEEKVSVKEGNSGEDKGIRKYIGVFVSGLIIGIIIGVAFLSSVYVGNNSTISAEEAGQKAVDWISNYAVRPGTEVKLINVSEVDGEGIYRLSINLSMGNISQVVQSYITKDAKYLFPQGIPTGEFAELKKEIEQQNKEQEQKLEIPKSDTPDIKLFVMSYCPYGLQAEKAFLPVYKLLKDKADMTINFVSYAMHGKKELDENLRQYCIQLEQEDTFYEYLSCFVVTGNYTKCLEEAKIDKTKLNSCTERVDKEYNITEMYNDRSTWVSGRFPLFNVEADLNEKYGVRGSPTLVINDIVITSNRVCDSDDDCLSFERCRQIGGRKFCMMDRAPEAYKEAICSAFTNPPEECNQKLSESPTSPGFGGGV
ncbi:MAG: hypothetical protein DRP10_03390 [Candidatus Aenigmatarchaeota archaeon]|nr:MAG: hypothetical protein DRP10_03390 [Candidatus Aenigmarchaeota archaeon]